MEVTTQAFLLMGLFAFLGMQVHLAVAGQFISGFLLFAWIIEKGFIFLLYVFVLLFLLQSSCAFFFLYRCCYVVKVKFWKWVWFVIGRFWVVPWLIGFVCFVFVFILHSEWASLPGFCNFMETTIVWIIGF